MAVFDTFGQNDTMGPSDILDLARKWYYLIEFQIFWNIKMLLWPNFDQNFCIFGLKSLKMAVFDVVLSKRCYETSWYFGFSYKIILFNGNFIFWNFKILGWPIFFKKRRFCYFFI